MSTRWWVIAVALVSGCAPGEIDEGLAFGFGPPASTCSGECVDASGSSSDGDAFATAQDSDGDETEAETEGPSSTSSSTGAAPIDECPADAECHFDADCITNTCVDCACVDPADGDSGTTADPMDGPNADPYGDCGGCQEGEQAFMTTGGCVCSTPCAPFSGNVCPAAPEAFQSSCLPVGNFKEGQCALVCEPDDPQCPEGASCLPTQLGYTICSYP